jgi:hypothetical protein
MGGRYYYERVMSRRPTAGIVLVLLLAGIVGPLFAAPHRALAGLRATTCCGGKCPNSLPTRMASDCCEIRRSADDAAAPSQASRIDPPRAHTLLPPPGSVAVAREHDVVLGSWSLGAGQRAAPPPVFLLIRTLRL